MSKSHLKRLAVPKTWDIKKKGIKFVTRPNLGAHPRKLSVPINLVIRDLLSYAKSNKEVKYILSENLINGRNDINITLKDRAGNLKELNGHWIFDLD